MSELIVSTRERVNFYCADCKTAWCGAPDRVEDNPDAPWHPWSYFGKREGCACDREKCQAAWERNLLKAHAHATGPTTPEGKASSSANLDGHPTPSEARFTRLNALKHGLYAKSAPYFPAKPGKYPHCDTCEYFNNGCNELHVGESGHKNPPACLKRVELQMQVMQAHDLGDARLMGNIVADLQAKIIVIIDNIILEVLKHGTMIESPQWYHDKDGGFHLAEYSDENGKHLLMKLEQNPLLNSLKELMKTMGLTLPDSNMTLASQDSSDTLKGFLDQAGGHTEELLDFERRQVDALEKLQIQVQASQDATKRDPVYREYIEGEVVNDG